MSPRKQQTDRSSRSTSSPAAPVAASAGSATSGLSVTQMGLSRTGFILAPIIIALLVAWAISHLGMIQFGGFDHSVLVDVGWRQVQGQRPHIDFPCTLPAGFFIGAK